MNLQNRASPPTIRHTHRFHRSLCACRHVRIYIYIEEHLVSLLRNAMAVVALNVKPRAEWDEHRSKGSEDKHGPLIVVLVSGLHVVLVRDDANLIHDLGETLLLLIEVGGRRVGDGGSHVGETTRERRLDSELVRLGASAVVKESR